ncbi:BREX-2 system adenine-specific DNA-methyltransferase PglX [Actinopolymorpha sp. NPDC004070]|uniref:BREX-2 system adenine-specific DNA-methyltransferase PglX n=1 Tax=Actinopolymorpha sp. NPDC004070 TaxID=3154548 RepID=UPI0033A18D79
MIDARRLLTDLQRQVRSIEADLLRLAESDGSAADRLAKRYEAAIKGKRTGLPFETWRGQQLTQVAAGWVLACVFARFCEDNRLLEQAMLAGPGERLAEARERQDAYFREYSSHSDLDYLRAAINRLEDSEVTRALVERQNPLHVMDPSPDTATALLDFWRRIDPETGLLVHDFTDPSLSTRFLGDLYQDLSEQARKDYALLQTPEFVEEFILDRTLDPAIEEFGLADVRLIDPACGSGHFLLGAFTRLLRRWQHLEPGADVRVHVERVLRQVNGVDINPYAVAIARFRLLVAALTSCGISRLKDAPAWRVRVAIGDSLLFGTRNGQAAIAGVTEAAMAGQSGEGEFVYEYEDATELEEILGDRYHAVVANPPYITVKDPVLNKSYRDAWSSCSGSYALSVPFAERIFDLATVTGFTGQITSNSFMKREFGRKLIEAYFPTVDLSLVIDTSGAYIPGHGTPTVLLFGRHRQPVSQTMRAVLGVRGEPSAPTVPAEGLVWSSIVDSVDMVGANTEYVSVVDVDRSLMRTHPWSLSGGGAGDVMRHLDEAKSASFASFGKAVTGAVTREDDVYLVGLGALRRNGIAETMRRALVVGDDVRDWRLQSPALALWPYGEKTLTAKPERAVLRFLWPYRAQLQLRVAFGKSQLQRGLSWFEYSMFFGKRYEVPFGIGFAFVSTHNHFVLDRGGKVFNRTAPVIKLPEGAAEEEHLRLLGLLNSSTACFWLKQVSHNKGNEGYQSGIKTEMWERFYEFTGTKLQEFPLPGGAPLALATRLDSLAQELQRATPEAVAEKGAPDRETLNAAQAEWSGIRAEMISAQEELDWEVYGLYGLLGDDSKALAGKDVSKPPLKLGERAFEIALARKMAVGEVETQWFARHGSTSITELPDHWPADYRALVERRLEKIADDPYLHLIERPECKRRWATRSWEDMEADALRGWLQDRLEDRALWFRPEPTLRSAAQLADELRTDEDFVSVAQLYARDQDLLDVVRDLVRDQHVPGNSAWRYTDSGMRVRKAWEQTWDLQRREDAGEKVGKIAVPPKYKQGDFRSATYWRNRGKLDVPKERFTSYPESSRDGTLLLGWAGFDHLQQAQALVAYVTERQELDAWGAEQLVPLLAALAELLPWIRQWHPDVDPEFGQAPADAYDGYLDQVLLQLGLTRDDLTAWRPPAPTRGRRRKTT